MTTPTQEARCGVCETRTQCASVCDVWICITCARIAVEALAKPAYPRLADGSRDPRDRSPAACCKCQKPVEEGRLCYAYPICYACLPPPPPIPVLDIG